MQAVDFVWKLEEFETDFAAFCRFVDIDVPEPVNEDLSEQFAEGRRIQVRSKDVFVKSFENKFVV